MHSELSEALEDHRRGARPDEVWDVDGASKMKTAYPVAENGGLNKPCGIPSELADVMIRILDFCGANGIDIEKAVTSKMAYNITRPYKHGGKTC